MIYLAAILFSLSCILLGGYVLACVDSEAPPPRLTDRSAPGAPTRSVLIPPAGNHRKVEAAPHRGRLVAWGGSIFGGRR